MRKTYQNQEIDTSQPVVVGARNLHRVLDLLLGRQPVAGMIRRWRYS